MTPPAGWTHGRVEIRLARLLDEHVTRHKLGVAFGSSTGYDLPSGDTVEPDVSFVSTERFAAHPPRTADEFLRVGPTLVVEILSPGTAKRDRAEKKAIYELNGVDEYWIVDTREKAVTVFRLSEGGYDVGRTFRSGTVRSHVLPKLKVRIRELFIGANAG